MTVWVHTGKQNRIWASLNFLSFQDFKVQYAFKLTYPARCMSNLDTGIDLKLTCDSGNTYMSTYLVYVKVHVKSKCFPTNIVEWRDILEYLSSLLCQNLDIIWLTWGLWASRPGFSCLQRAVCVALGNLVQCSSLELSWKIFFRSRTLSHSGGSVACWGRSVTASITWISPALVWIEAHWWGGRSSAACSSTPGLSPWLSWSWEGGQVWRRAKLKASEGGREHQSWWRSPQSCWAVVLLCCRKPCHAGLKAINGEICNRFALWKSSPWESDKINFPTFGFLPGGRMSPLRNVDQWCCVTPEPGKCRSSDERCVGPCSIMESSLKFAT